MDDSQLRTPFHCEHDTLYINCQAEKVSEDDDVRLQELGFFVDEFETNYVSYRFGSF